MNLVSDTVRLPERFAASATINPRASLDEVLALAAKAGFASFEVMTDWAASAFDVHAPPATYLRPLRENDLSVTSYHLPRLRAGDASTPASAAAGVRMAGALGAGVVILKADTLETYVQHSRTLLDQAEALGLQTVITNHKGSAIATLENVQDVLQAVNDDRLGCLLEVGHFAAVGEDWLSAAKALSARIKLVHIKDMRDGRPAPYGTGEIDFRALFRWLNADNYLGTVVVEIEGVADDAVERSLSTAVRVVTETAQAEGFQ